MDGPAATNLPMVIDLETLEDDRNDRKRKAEDNKASTNSFSWSTTEGLKLLRENFLVAENNVPVCDFGGLPEQRELDSVLEAMKSVSNIPETGSERHSIQPQVAKILVAALSATSDPPPRKQFLLGEEIPFPNSLRPLTESEIARTGIANSDYTNWARRARVFCPISGRPDFGLGICRFSGNAAVEKVKSTLPLEALGALLPLEVKPIPKPMIREDPNSPLHVIQAAAYTFQFLLRVFPLLDDNVIDRIFGPERLIHTPLLSHKRLFIVTIDSRKFIQSPGKILVKVSEEHRDRNYAVWLCRWVSWAKDVLAKLAEYWDDLDRIAPKNSWISSRQYTDTFGDPAEYLTARPSFFNPIRHSTTHYYRIFPNFWTNNRSLFPPELYIYLLQCGWNFKNISIKMPDLGSSLQDLLGSLNPPHKLDCAKTCEILLKVVRALKSLKGLQHMDLRAANIMLKGCEVFLIDFDYSRAPGNFSLMDRSDVRYAPEWEVAPVSDMWSIGMLVRRMAVHERSALLSADTHDNLAIAVAALTCDDVVFQLGESEPLRKVLKQCLVIDPALRAKIDDVEDLLKEALACAG